MDEVIETAKENSDSLIIGVAAGVCGAVVLAAAAFVCYRMKANANQDGVTGQAKEVSDEEAV